MGKRIDITGQVFGELTVLHQVERSESGGTYWACQCSCGNTIKADSSNLRRGKANSCGCKKYIDITNQRFGRLVAHRLVENDKRGAFWYCTCDCGGDTTVNGNILRSGRTLSCGCLQKEVTAAQFTTHGLSHSPEYKIWNSMIQRCQSDHPNYGARGILVCDKWQNSFEAFYQDVGPRPDESYTLDRRDNDGNYEPGNCRWADRTTQTLNQGIRSDNKTGIKGVSETSSGKYLAELRVHGEVKLKKEFPTIEEATEARRQAEEEHHSAILGNREGR